MHMKRLVERHFHTRSNHEELETLQHAIVMRQKQKKKLGWAAEKGIKEMCADSWKWQSMNPDGYRTED